MVWTLFDNEFNLVKSSSGMVKIPNTPDTRQDIVKTDIIMERGGYFYAYLVNESSMNVYFDDFQVTHVTGKVLEENHYYPFGLLNAQLSTRPTEKPLNHYKYNDKELQKELNSEWLDYGARFYDPQIGRWYTVDNDAENYFESSPFSYVRNSPIMRIDPTGRWDITVHLFNDRSKHGYGIAIVTDRNGNEIYRFNVRGEGIGGRNRMKDDADTPLGVYDIPDSYTDMWKTGGDRGAYGPNARLIMTEESGEIIKSGRSLIRIHGGRQEIYNETNNTWEVVDNPTLEKTQGCLRAFDSDMAEFKNVINQLMKNDPKEYGGKVSVKDDLNQKIRWKGVPYKSNINNVTYHAPGDDASEEELDAWYNLVNLLLNPFK